MKYLAKSITWAISMTMAAISCTGCSSDQKSISTNTTAEQAAVGTATALTDSAETTTAAEENETQTTAQTLINHLTEEEITGTTRASYDADDMTSQYDTYDAEITLADDDIVVTGSDTEGVQVEGNQVIISQSGVYYLTGKLSDGRITITGEDKVQLYLDGVSVTSTSGAALDCTNQKRTILSLAPASENAFTERFSCVGDVDEDISAIYAKDKLTINGSGSLIVNGTTGNGILCKDDLKITGGSIQVTAATNGIKGTESIAVYNGNITIDAGNDGMKSTNSDDEQKGWIAIDGGTLNISAGGDGIQAKTTLEIANGDLTVETVGDVAESSNNGGFGGFGGGNGGMTPPDGFGGGNGGMTPPDGFGGGNGGMTPPDGFGGGNGGMTPPDGFGGGNGDMTPPDGSVRQDDAEQPAADNNSTESSADSNDLSSKGLKSGGDMTISGGSISLTTTDHSVHSGGAMTISGGTWQIDSSRGKGISAHGNLEISGTNTAITIENCTEGIESKANLTIDGGNIRILNATDDGLNTGGSNNDGGSHVMTIAGGTVYINSRGDGFDSNGDVNFHGGTLIISGPTSGADGSFDGDGTMTYTGGLILGLSSKGMMEFPETGCMVTTSANAAAGDVIAVLDEQGQVVIAVQSEKAVSDVIFSVGSDTADITKCQLVTGCTYNGTFNEDGWATGGTISGGTTVDWAEASVSNITNGFGGGFGGGGKPSRDFGRNNTPAVDTTGDNTSGRQV